MHIVYEETKRMLRGMLPAGAGGPSVVFALCGQGIGSVRRKAFCSVRRSRAAVLHDRQEHG